MEKLNRRTKRVTGASSLIFGVVCLLCILTGQSTFAETLLFPEDFIGPLPGVTYLYEQPGGNGIELRGLTRDEDGALLIEESFITIQHESELKKVSTYDLMKVYGMTIDGKDRVLKREFSNDGSIHYSVELDTRQPVWGNPFIMKKQGSAELKDGKKMTSKCRIVKQSRQFLFGRERTVLEVSGEYCTPRTYASGIGLIDINGIKLKQIKVKGQVVYNY